MCLWYTVFHIEAYKAAQILQIHLGKGIDTGQLILMGGGWLESKRPVGSRRF